KASGPDKLLSCRRVLGGWCIGICFTLKRSYRPDTDSVHRFLLFGAAFLPPSILAISGNEASYARDTAASISLTYSSSVRGASVFFSGSLQVNMIRSFAPRHARRGREPIRWCSRTSLYTRLSRETRRPCLPSPRSSQSDTVLSPLSIS